MKLIADVGDPNDLILVARGIKHLLRRRAGGDERRTAYLEFEDGAYVFVKLTPIGNYSARVGRREDQ